LIRTVYELHGIECFTGSMDIPKSKRHILNSRSFGNYIDDFDTLAAAVTHHTSQGGQEMRQKSLCANALNVFIHTNKQRVDLPQHFGSVTVGVAATDYTSELVKAALSGLREIWKPGYQYKKAGVMLLDLVPEGNWQRSLLNHRDMDKADRLMEALDSINGTLGKGTIKLGTEGFKNAWAMRQEHLSQRYTTRWEV
jgi:DNA polymerase V